MRHPAWQVLRLLEHCAQAEVVLTDSKTNGGLSLERCGKASGRAVGSGLLKKEGMESRALRVRRKARQKTGLQGGFFRAG